MSKEKREELVIEVNISRFREVKTIKILQFLTCWFPKKKVHFSVCWGVLRVVIISTTYLLNILTEKTQQSDEKGSFFFFCRPDTTHMMCDEEG